MNIKKIAHSTSIFIIKRLIEIFGIIVVFLGVLLFFALITYSPSDPNFIFSENTEIKNILGFQGSYTSDIFFQSIGLISLLIPLTLILVGLNIFRQKVFFLFIESLFFIITYSLIGSFFFNYFYSNTFSIHINGNGGFIGEYLNQSFLNSIVSYNETISYYTLILITLILFLVSINFKTKYFIQGTKKKIKYFV